MTEVLTRTPGGLEHTIAQEPESQPARKSADERKESLARLVTAQVAGGARVESGSDYQAVLVRGHRTNNTLHLILTLCTAGLWGIVWIAVAAIGGEKRSVASVDEWGNSAIQSV
jgi:hypothetical protein